MDRRGRLGGGESLDLRPSDDEAVVGERLLRPLLALADEVEAVGEVARHLGSTSRAGAPGPPRPPSPSSSRRIRCCVTSQTVRRLSSPGPSPSSSSSRRSSRTLPALGLEDAGLDHARPPRCSWPCDSSLGLAELARRPCRAARTKRSPTRVGVELALLLGEHLVERLVDEASAVRTGIGEPSASSDLRVAREDRHARADGGLRQVDRRDVAVLKLPKRVGQLRASARDELRRVSQRRVAGRGRQTRTMEEARALVPMPTLRAAQLAPHRPSPVDQRSRHRSSPSSIVSQPVEATLRAAIAIVSLSACLKA